MKKTIFAMVVVLVAMNAQAANIWCDGTVQNVYLTKDGSAVFNATWRGDYTQACNVNSVWNGISVEVCRDWLSMLMTAKVSGSKVLTMYEDVASCNVIPIYGSAPAPYYIMLAP